MPISNIGLQEIHLDISTKLRQKTFYANEVDTEGRGLHAFLQDNGVKVDGTGVTMQFRYKSFNDGESKVYDFTPIGDPTNGEFEIHYPTEMVRGHGNKLFPCTIVANDLTSELAFENVFVYVNKAEVNTEGIEASNEYSALKKSLDDVLVVQEQLANITPEQITQVTTAETNRVTAETNRGNSETSRVNAESDRATAEGLRVTAESDRATAENLRATAEATREANDQARGTYVEAIEANYAPELNGVKSQLADIDQRVDAIIITPVEGVSAQEIVDARGGYSTLNQRIQAVDDASVKTVNGTAPDNDGNIAVSVSGAKPTHDITVGKQGCDYTTIAAALAYGKTLAPTKVNLHVHNGVYEEVIDLRYNTNVCIIGENKKECIIINKSGLYANSPLMVSGENYIKNMTFIANHESNPSFSAPYAYAMHYDYTGPGETIFENCRFESYQNAAVGIGMHQDQTLKFIDCDMYSDSAVYDGGSLYFHNAVASGVTNQHLVIERGSIYSKTGYAVKADDANIGSGDGLGNEMDVTFIDVSIHSDVYGETIDKNTAPIGVDALVGNVKLHPRTSWNKGLKSNNTGSNGQVLTSNGDGTCEFKNSGAALGVSNFSATVGTTWAGTVPPYSQAISVPGISASDNPFVDVVLSGDYSTDVSILAAWDNVYRITTGEGSITVFSSAANTASIPIQLKVVK